MNRALFIYGGLSLAATATLFYFINLGTPLNWYLNWLITCSIILFCLYGIDKSLAKMGALRVPNIVLHGMAIIGGFAGGFLGRVVFNHKTNTDRNYMFPIVLIGSAIFQFALFYVYRTYLV